MAPAHLAYPNLAFDKLSGTEPNQNAESYIQLFERKNNFALRDAREDANKMVNYTFRKKALFSFLLGVPTAEWYENSLTHDPTWQMFEKNS